MRPTILVLVSEALTAYDVKHIVSLEADVSPQYCVLTPADTDRNMFVSFMNHLLMGEVHDAWVAIREPEASEDEARTSAQELLDTTLEAFRAEGATCIGAITADDPLPALQAAVTEGQGNIYSIIIVTEPLALEDTFRQDWASRARELLTVPVLHIYRGTDMLG